MKILFLIIKREFIAKVRNKSFMIMTFASPLLGVLLIAFVAYLSTMKADVKQMAIHDESGLFVEQFESNEEYQYTNVSSVDVSLIKQNVEEEKYDGLIYIPKQEEIKGYEDQVYLISNDSPSLSFVSKVELLIADKLTHVNLQESGIDTKVIDEAQAKVNIKLAKATGETTVKGLNEIKIAIGSIFGYFIMMFIIIYGNLVMRSVIEEKTNRIIEIIISSVKPFDLMMGKIIGTSMAGILQFVIWGIIGGVLLVGVQMFLGVDTTSGVTSTGAVGISGPSTAAVDIRNYLQEILSLPLFSLLVSFIVFFIGGYFLYSSLYAAIGAAVDNETDTQQFVFPVLLPLMLALYIGFFTVINDPHGTVATVFSFIPFTSPIVMLMRIPFGVPLWQIILSVTLLFGTFIGTVWFASKIYRVGILMFGKKPTWKELYRWLKY